MGLCTLNSAVILVQSSLCRWTQSRETCVVREPSRNRLYTGQEGQLLMTACNNYRTEKNRDNIPPKEEH